MKTGPAKVIAHAIVASLCLLGTASAVDPVAATPKPFESTTSGIHRITFKARIDSRAEIILQDGKMFLDTKGAIPPENVVVNGRKWTAAYTNGVSADFKFGAPVMPFAGRPITAKLSKSRGSANIRQQPTPENGQKLIIALEDSAAGPGDFDLVISW